MGAFLFRCPTTGTNVHGWIADDPTRREERSHEPVSCYACRGVHLVNPKTGKVIGEDDDE